MNVDECQITNKQRNKVFRSNVLFNVVQSRCCHLNNVLMLTITNEAQHNCSLSDMSLLFRNNGLISVTKRLPSQLICVFSKCMYYVIIVNPSYNTCNVNVAGFPGLSLFLSSMLDYLANMDPNYV